jgi:hypothetical protein
MLGWGLGFLGGLLNFANDPVGAVAGWTFDKVTAGVYEWLARGLALLVEWVWRVLDAGATPRLTEDWFANELAGRVGALALAVTVAMMLASAIQTALAGRPEQVLDAVKEAARAIVATALLVTVVDHMVGIVDAASATVWDIGRDDLVAMIERMVRVSVETGPLGRTFIGPLCQLFGYLGLFGLTISLLMRGALIYLVAAFAPLVFSASILPAMRDSSRRLIHLLVALIASKLAIVISLVVAVQLAANAGAADTGHTETDAAAAVGTLVTGFACFLVAAISPAVLYRLMPTVEGAVASAGVVGGWGRAALSVGQAALMAKGLGAAAAATRAVAGQGGVAGGLGRHQGAAGQRGGGGQGSSDSPRVTGLAAATRAATSGQAGSGSAGSRDGGATDGNLPPLPDAEQRGGPAPWVAPGAPADESGTDVPRYATGTAAADGGGAREAVDPGGGLPPLPPTPPPSRPWAPPGAPASEGKQSGTRRASGSGEGGR